MIFPDVSNSPLLGRKVKLHTKFGEWNGEQIPYICVNDPEFVAEAKEMYGEKAVVLCPGSLIDASVRMNRVKVKVDKDGIVYCVTRG